LAAALGVISLATHGKQDKLLKYQYFFHLKEKEPNLKYLKGVQNLKGSRFELIYYNVFRLTFIRLHLLPNFRNTLKKSKTIDMKGNIIF
jgi:hypothetical protein